MKDIVFLVDRHMYKEKNRVIVCATDGAKTYVSRQKF